MDGNGYTDVIISTELGDIIVMDYELDILYNGNVGEEILEVLFGRIAASDARFLIAKDFEIVLAETSGQDIVTVSKFSTGNRFYSVILDEDELGGYEIVAGGEAPEYDIAKMIRE